MARNNYFCLELLLTVNKITQSLGKKGLVYLRMCQRKVNMVPKPKSNQFSNFIFYLDRLILIGLLFISVYFVKECLVKFTLKSTTFEISSKEKNFVESPTMVSLLKVWYRMKKFMNMLFTFQTICFGAYSPAQYSQVLWQYL